MAQLSNLNGQKILLNRYHIFGRDPFIAQTVLNDPTCCKLHAVTFFEHNKWYFEDYSLNGTIVNNKKVMRQKIPLHQIKTIQFGEQQWKVECDSPPCSFLKSTDNDFLKLNDQSYNVNYNDTNFLLFQNNNNWLLGNQDNVFLLNGGEVISYQQKKWIFVKNNILTETIQSTQQVIKLSFVLSENFEHVKITLDSNGSLFKLPYKSHNFLLYLLAKKRVTDQKERGNNTENGWIVNDDLLQIMSKELLTDCDVYYLNLQIHRIRKQFKKIGAEFQNIIERRKGEIRINVDQITIDEPQYSLYQSTFNTNNHPNNTTLNEIL